MRCDFIGRLHSGVDLGGKKDDIYYEGIRLCPIREISFAFAF
jgi:hypothetical protein